MNRRYLAATLGSATLFASLFAAVAWLSPRPRLLWNASASAPIGLYSVEAAPPAVGDLVAIFDEVGNVCLEEREALIECVAVEYPRKCLCYDERDPESSDRERRVFAGRTAPEIGAGHNNVARFYFFRKIRRKRLHTMLA